MQKVKIYGAGSIGNHLSNAARAIDWSVDLCDVDPAALDRARNEIYPSRYGKWDDAISLYKNEDAPMGGYDLICIGTPPDSHMALAIAAVQETPKAILVEKPLCTPDLADAQDLSDLCQDFGVDVFTGYDHVVGLAAESVSAKLAQGTIGKVLSIDVEFREFWGGIFDAHPWLDGPHDSYLGYSHRGGGASGEHSHATNLWQHFSHMAGAGRVVEVSASLDFVDDGQVKYDRLCIANLTTESGLVGRVVQDVITQPPRKWARIQGENGYLEWQCGFEPGCDAVTSKVGDLDDVTELFRKTRPDDFIQELNHISAAVDNDEGLESGISLARGLDTMLVVAAMLKSSQEKRTVFINYAKGYTLRALE